MKRIVVLDHAGGTAAWIRRALEDHGCNVTQVADVGEATRALEDPTNLLVVNPCIQPSMVFSPLENLVHEAREVPVLVLAGCAPVEEAVRVLFPLASAVIRTPLSDTLLRDAVLGTLRGVNGNGRSEPKLSGLGRIVGSSPPMQKVYRRVRQAARSDASVLLTGETGSGKELVAKTIHELSARREGPFVVVSCAELPENLIESELFGHARGSFTGAHRARAGLFEAAHGGTLLLDEISDASSAVQMRLLRVVEERQVRRVGEVQVRGVDVRLIAATQESLKNRMGAGKFREDLFYRLRVLTIPLPPLRERREDIPALAAHYMRKVAGPGREPQRFSPLALEALVDHAWPGNVRELLSVIDAARTARPEGAITASDLPVEVTSSWSADGRVQDQSSRILKALEEADGRRGRAAEILGISRTTLWRRMIDLGIHL